MPDESFKPTRGRPPKSVKRDDWHVKVEADLSLYFRMKFHDEFTGRTRLGELSNLVNRLLREERDNEQKANAK